MTSFIRQTNDRQLDPEYCGDILLWDIDKTYLDTHFSSKRGLITIPFETAIDKRSVPGAPPLLRALRRGSGSPNALVPLYFVSGSPPQLQRVIEKRMTMDGVQYDGLTFKDQWALLRAGRPQDIGRQVGYKMKALLSYWKIFPRNTRWWMFGDDVEDDAEAFVLFGRVCAGFRQEALDEELRQRRVHPHDRTEIHTLLLDEPVGPNPVERVLIHLTRNSPPERFTHLSQVVACQSHLQSALVMATHDKIRPDAITAVARDLRQRGISEAIIETEIIDAEHRLKIPETLTVRVRT